jgi:hypothetical protein
VMVGIIPILVGKANVHCCPPSFKM